MVIEAVCEERWLCVGRCGSAVGQTERKFAKARMEEVGFMKRQSLWDRNVASGHRTVSAKWVDTNKGTNEGRWTETTTRYRSIWRGSQV